MVEILCIFGGVVLAFVLFLVTYVRTGVLLLEYMQERQANWIPYQELLQGVPMSKRRLDSHLRSFSECSYVLTRFQTEALNELVDRGARQLCGSDSTLSYDQAARLTQQELTMNESKKLDKDEWIELYEFRYKSSGGRRKKTPHKALLWEIFRPAYA